MRVFPEKISTGMEDTSVSVDLVQSFEGLNRTKDRGGGKSLHLS